MLGYKLPLRKDLARVAGCSPEEIAINRNASEALETVIFGLNLKAGDEVVLSKYDYPNCINAWKQRESREGIKLVWVDLNLPSEDNDYMASQYVKAFTPRNSGAGNPNGPSAPLPASHHAQPVYSL